MKKVGSHSSLVVVVCVAAVALGSCGSMYVSDEVGAQRRAERIAKTRQTVIDALAGGTGPITLHGLPGDRTAMIEVVFDDNKVCGNAIKVRTVAADGIPGTLEYPGGMRIEDRSRPMRVCFPYVSFYRASPGSF